MRDLNRLRLVNDRDDDRCDPIPFPTLPRSGSMRPSIGPDDAGDAQDRAVRLAQQIERSLDDVQRRLDSVKDQLDDAYRLPWGSDPPPAAA